MDIALRSKHNFVLVLLLVLDLFPASFQAIVIFDYEDEHDDEDDLLFLSSLPLCVTFFSGTQFISGQVISRASLK
jgi:hypothetical protein